MQVTHIFETVIYADDLAAAERFYHDVLGLAVYSRSETVVSFRLAGGVLLVFDPRRATQPNRGVPSHGAQGPAIWPLPPRRSRWSSGAPIWQPTT